MTFFWLRSSAASSSVTPSAMSDRRAASPLRALQKSIARSHSVMLPTLSAARMYLYFSLAAASDVPSSSSSSSSSPPPLDDEPPLAERVESSPLLERPMPKKRPLAVRLLALSAGIACFTAACASGSTSRRRHVDWNLPLDVVGLRALALPRASTPSGGLPNLASLSLV